MSKKLHNPLRFSLGFLVFGLVNNLILAWPKISPLFEINNLPSSVKFQIFFNNIFSLAELYTPGSGLITLVNAALFGLVLNLLWKQYKRNKQDKAAIGTSTLAGILATIGAGCGACGTLILGPLLATFGATGLLAVLPGHGLEFGLLGTILLIYSFIDLRKKIRRPHVCKV